MSGNIYDKEVMSNVVSFIQVFATDIFALIVSDLSKFSKMSLMKAKYHCKITS